MFNNGVWIFLFEMLILYELILLIFVKLTIT